jgi:hypothetical protein
MTEMGAAGPVEQFFQAGKILPQRKNKTANLIKLKSSQAPSTTVRYLLSFVSFLEACFPEEHKKLDFSHRVPFVVCFVKEENLGRTFFEKIITRRLGLGH